MTQEIAAVVVAIVAAQEGMAKEKEAVPNKVRTVKTMLRSIMEAWSSAVMMMN